MQGFLFEGLGKAGLVERQMPAVGSKDVLIKVMACGICGTDIHILKGESMSTPPVVLGHEFAGEVVGIGEQVTTVGVGDRVCIDPNVFCGTCYYCRNGKEHLCENLKAIGVDVDGGFAQYCAVPHTHVYRLPDNVSYREGAMVEPVACCLRGIDRAGIRPGDEVAVLGGGPIGLILAQLAKAAGGHVTISEPNQEKWDLIHSLGFEKVVKPQELVSAGYNVVIEAVGLPAAVEQTIDIARRGATVVWFSVVAQGVKVKIEPFQVFRKELTITGSFINPSTHARAIKLISSGQVCVAPLLTHSYPLDQIEAGFAKQQEPDSVKVVIEPNS